MTLSVDDVRATQERAIAWLASSGIRNSEGAYQSIYRPKTREYVNWFGNQTCLLSTSGAVLALDRCGCPDLAVRSAEHICALAYRNGGWLRGSLLSGRGGEFVFANWMSTAIVALLQVHERCEDDRCRMVAENAGRFIAGTLQNRDGSITQTMYLSARTDPLRRLARPREIWVANSVEALLHLHRATGDDLFRSSASRFVEWLLAQQRPDGSFPMYRHSILSRAAALLVQKSTRRTAEDSSTCHPTALTQSVNALILLGRTDQARQAAHWLMRRLSPNGLLYQFYFSDGTHSVEEDVMPTAHLGCLLVKYAELEATRECLARIAAGVASAQIRSADRNADGAMRGLPGHPTAGEDAYCWDTVHSILFLREFLERHAG